MTTFDDVAAERTNISALERRSARIGVPFRLGSTIAYVLIVVACVGPLVLLAKWSVSTSQDIIRDPFGWWPSGLRFGNLAHAWSDVGIGRYLLNTVWMVLSSLGLGLFVALTGGYTIAILRPRYARVLSGAVLATLFVPAVITLIPLYLVVLDVPLLGANLLNTFWAVCLPASANAFHVLLVIRFFERLPAEIFEAAKIDGAGPVRVFWQLVLPLSRPIIGVVSLLIVLSSWKEFLWPLLVLNRTEVQPLAVAIARMQEKVDVATLMASLFIAVIIPIALFLLLQRHVMRAAGQTGAVKG